MFTCDRCGQFETEHKAKLVKFDLKVRKLCKRCADYVTGWFSNPFTKDARLIESLGAMSKGVYLRKQIKNNRKKYHFGP